MLTPIRDLRLSEGQRRAVEEDGILAMDREGVALLHQPERGNGVYVLDEYERPRGAAVEWELLLALHREGKGRRRWRFYTHTDADALERARRRLGM